MSRKQTRFAMSRANPISWVAMSIVMPPAASSRTTLSTSATSSGSSADVTSSRSRRSGSIASARTIATRCCWPPERRSGYACALSASPNRANRASASRSATCRRCLSTFRGASVTLSSTLMWGNRLNAWNTMPIRRRIRLTSTLLAVISSPSIRIRPASMGSIRLTQRRRVDLPLPDAPISATTSCSATSRSIPWRTGSAPNDFQRPSTRRAGVMPWGSLTGGQPSGRGHARRGSGLPGCPGQPGPVPGAARARSASR